MGLPDPLPVFLPTLRASLPFSLGDFFWRGQGSGAGGGELRQVDPVWRQFQVFFHWRKG